VARREAQTYGIAVSCKTARAPRGAPHALDIDALSPLRSSSAKRGSALKSSACYFATVPAFGLRFSSAKLRLASHQPAPGRTSYWVRGGPRCRPGASLRNKPASAAPRPANANASRQRPSEGRGGRSLREVMGGGDKFGFVSNAPGDRCLGRDINEGLRDIVGRFV
jgi:hypothetical protein